MRHIILLILLPFTVFGQVHNFKKFRDLSTEKSIDTIRWYTATKESNLKNLFDHHILFTNKSKDNIVGSDVEVLVMQNNVCVLKTYFAAADGEINFLSFDKNKKIKTGDEIYVILKLKKSSNNESFVYEVRDNRPEKKNEVILAKTNVKPIVQEKKKEVKHKSYKVSYRPKRNQKIGQEINGREAAL